MAWPNGVRQSYWLLAGQEFPTELRRSGLVDDLNGFQAEELQGVRAPVDDGSRLAECARTARGAA